MDLYLLLMLAEVIKTEAVTSLCVCKRQNKRLSPLYKKLVFYKCLSVNIALLHLCLEIWGETLLEINWS